MRIQLLTVVLLVGSLLFVACKKEGCTNPTATNYNTEAEKDDGLCVFESQPKNPHVYTMVSSSGDTLLHGYVPYQDGHAYTGINEDNNRYCFKSRSEERRVGKECRSRW